MRSIFHLVPLLLALAGAAFACPVPADMKHGVLVVTLGPDGVETRHLFRKSAPRQVIETRRTQHMSGTLMLERTLFLGLLPTEQRVLEGSARDRRVHSSRTSYPEQEMSRLRFGPGLRFTVEQSREWVDGRIERRFVHYALGIERKRRYFGCLVPTVEITVTQKGGPYELRRSYAYFTQLGFGIELARTSAAEATAFTIISIDKAGE